MSNLYVTNLTYFDGEGYFFLMERWISTFSSFSISASVLIFILKCKHVIWFYPLSNFVSVKVFNEETKILVIRISRSSSSVLLTSMPFVSKIGKIPAMIQTLHVGGSIRSCEKVLVRYHKMELISSLNKTQNHSKLSLCDQLGRNNYNLLSLRWKEKNPSTISWRFEKFTAG